MVVIVQVEYPFRSVTVSPFYPLLPGKFLHFLRIISFISYSTTPTPRRQWSHYQFATLHVSLFPATHFSKSLIHNRTNQPRILHALLPRPFSSHLPTYSDFLLNLGERLNISLTPCPLPSGQAHDVCRSVLQAFFVSSRPHHQQSHAYARTCHLLQ